MFQSQIHRLLHNKLTRLVFFIILLIPCIEIVQFLYEKSVYGTDFHPAFITFLSGKSLGHATQLILLWFLPLYFLIMGADDPIQDYQTGMRNMLIARVGKRNYLLKKLAASYMVGFVTIFSALLVNFILINILFANGTFMFNLDSIAMEENSLFSSSVQHPYIANLLFGFTTCILAGFASFIGTAYSLFFLDKKYAYTAAFFTWFLLILKKDSLMYLVQPFAEYGLDVLIPIFTLTLLIFLLVPLLIFVYEVRYNEV